MAHSSFPELRRPPRTDPLDGAVPSRRARFRADIEGLRAIAVLLVLVYHAGVSSLSGGFIGVDVFFVVSGFVITALLLRELERTGTINLLTFYGRRAKRLLPAAGLVLIVTTLVAWALASRIQWQTIGPDIIGAATFVVNWVFSARSVDYLAEDVEPSPVLHFWSLAVEEQFYVIWPLLILAVVLLMRHRRWNRRLALGSVLLGVIVIPSFVFSIWYTHTHPQQAFFITPTRLWEMGVGALVAVAAARFRSLSTRLGSLLAIVGLGMVLLAGFVIGTSTTWPGAAALLPVLGTAAVIAGGLAAPRNLAARILSLRPLVWIGALSYSVYLWHWPLLRFWEWVYDTPSVPVGLLIVGLSFIPAWASYTFVESPIRHAAAFERSPRFALSMGANFTLVALVCGLLLTYGSQAGVRASGQATGAGWTAATQASGDGVDSGTDAPTSTEGAVPTENPAGIPDVEGPTVGAGEDAAGEDGGADSVIATGMTPPRAETDSDEPFFTALTPDPLNARKDTPGNVEDGCQATVHEDEVSRCDFGDPDGEVLLVAVGDSKLGQWSTALDQIGRENGWQVHVYSKSACSYLDATLLADEQPYTSCRTWADSLREHLQESPAPDVFLVSGLAHVGRAVQDPQDSSADPVVEGYRSYWRELQERGTLIVAISDSPRPSNDVLPAYECVDRHRDDLSACEWEYEQSAGSAAMLAAVQASPGAWFIDMDPWVCPDGTCVGAYRNILTYRQGSHLTATFVRALTEPLASHLVPLVQDHLADH